MIPETLWQWVLDQGPLTALLICVLIGGAKKQWVFGWAFEDVVKQRDQTKAAYDRLVEATSRAVGITSSSDSKGV